MCVEVLKALYGMLQSSLLFHKKLRKDLVQEGFKMNLHDPCVANQIVQEKQQTVSWHVDDLKSSHIDPKINDQFKLWAEDKYGDSTIGQVKTACSKYHDYLSMNLDYSTLGKVKVNMVDHTKNVIEDFSEDLSGIRANCPWNKHLFKVNKESKKLSKDKAEEFHTFVAKGLFLTKQAIPDVMPAITFLTTRVKEPAESDWFKLKKMLAFLNNTAEDVLTLEADGTNQLQCHLDASFAVH